MTTAHQHSFRVARLEVLACDTAAVLAEATGFFCEFEQHTFLVTNWHVVSGRHFQTNSPLHPSQALPGFLKVHTHLSDNVVHISAPSTSTTFQIPLLDRLDNPIWLEHPLFKDDVDVAAIHVDNLIPDCHRVPCINLATELKANRKLAVMDQAFVTGYPLSATTTPNSLPIYKSGSIASEPQVFDSVPRIYIDGKTKTGMSGSPVMVKCLGQDSTAYPHAVSQPPSGDSLNFVGVYSGRDRQERTEFEAELGIMWPFRECLLPIIEEYLNNEVSVSTNAPRNRRRTASNG